MSVSSDEGIADTDRYKMNNRYIEMAPQNVIWKNLSLNAYEQNVRRAISYAATFGLIILWVFPGPCSVSQAMGL